MKSGKYLVLGLGFLAVLVIAAWMLRNTIIERLSGPVLSQYGLTITDVSLDTLASRDASISYLELRHDNGAIIAMYDLMLPIRTAPAGVRRFRIGKITIDLPPIAGEESLDYFNPLAQFLELPQQLPGTEIVIGEIVAGDFPAVTDLSWRSPDGNQELAAQFDTMRLTAGATRISGSDYLLGLSFTDTAEPGATQSLALDLKHTNGAISITGSGALDLQRWSPIIALLELDVVDVQSGSATLQLDGEIAADPNQVPFLNAAFTPTTPVTMTIAEMADVISSITMESASRIEVTMTLTDLQWALAVSEMTLNATDIDNNAFAVSLANLSCTSAVACSSNVGVSANEVEFPFASIERLEITSQPDIALGPGEIRILLKPGATLVMRGISGPDVDLAGIATTITADTEVVGDDTSWRLGTQSADVNIERYSVYEGITFSIPLFIDAIVLEHNSGSTSATFDFYGAASAATWNDRDIQLPGARGRLVQQGADLRVTFETVGLYEQAAIEFRHNLDTDSGTLSLADGTQSFDERALSARVSPWNYDWDISAGQISLALQSAWKQQGEEWQVEAQASIDVARLAGIWQDTAFAGLSTSLNAGIDTDGTVTVQPSSLTIDLVEMGLPLENIAADYTLYPAASTVEVRNLRMDAFGGVIKAEPFSFSTASDSNNLLLIAESIDLAKLLTTDEFESIEISGTVGAKLPVTIEGQNLTISGGTLTGDAPGGVIRYLPGIGSDRTQTSGLGFATRALSNFEYETLASDVSYGRDGDLVLQMRIAGRNPNFENGRPIILNLGVENNVPQMLKSLQAARAVEEILERRLAQ